MEKLSTAEVAKAFIRGEITLSQYPKQFSEDGGTHKTDLGVFIKLLKRKFGEVVEYLWKLEFQKRGAPHYHIIVRLFKDYKHEYLKHWLSNSWYEVAQRF